jgi:hypothetical protein
VSGETDVENFLIPLDMKLSLLLHFAIRISLLYQSDYQEAGISVKILSLFWSYWFLSASLDVEEVRSLISQHSNLSIVLAFNPVITLSLSSLFILCLE